SCARTGPDSRGDERARGDSRAARAAPRRGGCTAARSRSRDRRLPQRAGRRGPRHGLGGMAAREALRRRCGGHRDRGAAPQARARMERAPAHVVAGGAPAVRRGEAGARRPRIGVIVLRSRAAVLPPTPARDLRRFLVAQSVGVLAIRTPVAVALGFELRESVLSGLFLTLLTLPQRVPLLLLTGISGVRAGILVRRN